MYFLQEMIDKVMADGGRDELCSSPYMHVQSNSLSDYREFEVINFCDISVFGRLKIAALRHEGWYHLLFFFSDRAGLQFSITQKKKYHKTDYL